MSLTRKRGSKPDRGSRPSGSQDRDGSGSGKTEDSRPPRDGRRRPRSRRVRRVRPIPPDIRQIDMLEDGHDRVIDPAEAGAEIWSDHGLQIRDLDSDAVKVVRRLVSGGFQAYLVGGCVRDLLAGSTPKDYDIATSATPRQVKQLFRNSRVIGRRFRLVHVFFREHILEVSTFRTDGDATKGDDLLIKRDNTFGRVDEDARRRDFTCNGLFFDVNSVEVIDFVGGMRDIKKRRIEMIGDAPTRLAEDPVRMLRAVKFAARLDFTIADDILAAIRDVRFDLRKSAAPRLFEEIQRLLGRGGAFASFDLLESTGLMEVLLPEIHRFLRIDLRWAEDSEFTLNVHQRFWNTLKSLDLFLEEGRPVSAVVRLCCLFIHLFDDVLHHKGAPPEGVAPVAFDIGVQTDRGLKPIVTRLQVPRRDQYKLKQLILGLRQLLSVRTGRKKISPARTVRKEYFPEVLRLFQIYSHAVGRFQGDVLRWERRYESVFGHSLEKALSK